MTKSKKILVISMSEFSGIKASIISALRKKECVVYEEKHSIRHLSFRPLYIFFMFFHAVLLYKSSFRQYIGRTYTAYWIHSKVNQAILDKYDDIDAVILMQLNYNNFYKKKLPAIRYTLLTDHTNLLSKKLPEFGYEVPERKIHHSWNKIEKNILKQQDHIFVMGTYVKESMIEDYEISSKKITVIGGGPNLNLDAERDNIIKNWNKKDILFVGLQPERKGLPILKQAFKKIIKEFPEAKLHVVGTEDLNDDNIFYYGKQKGEALKKLFYMTQIFVLPTLREPFGIVFLEAMWAKNACIGTNLGAIPEIIEHGGNGYVIEPGDHETLAKSIIELFRDPERLKNMGERSYELAKSKWNWERSAQKIITSLFEEAL